VLICPASPPAAPRQARSSWQVVVLPFVPVTPTAASFADGAP
jgi:hypothetical protein